MNRVLTLIGSHVAVGVVFVLVFVIWQRHREGVRLAEVGNAPPAKVSSERGSVENVTETKTLKDGYLNSTVGFYTSDLGDVEVTSSSYVRALFPKNEIEVLTMFLINSKTLLVGLEYSRDWFVVGGYGGWSFELRDWDVGIKLGWRYQW